MPELNPIGQYVFIELLPQDKSEGSIYVPPQEKSQKDMMLAKVTATGNGIYYKSKFVPNEVKVGDTILVTKLSIKRAKFDGKSLSYVRHVDIEAIVTSKD